MSKPATLETLGKVDVYRVDPFKLHIDENLRGRKFAPSEDKIREMEESLERFGQLEAIGIRRDAVDKSKWWVVFGATRTLAIRRLAEKDPKWRETGVLAKTYTCNEEEAFLVTLTENEARSNPSPIDLAHSIMILRNRFHKTTAEIAKMLNRTPGRITVLEGLALLPPEMQKDLHENILSEESALTAMQIPEGLRQEVIAEAVAEAEAKQVVFAEKATSANGSSQRGRPKGSKNSPKPPEEKETAKRHATVTKQGIVAASKRVAERTGIPEVALTTEMTMPQLKDFLTRNGDIGPCRNLLKFIAGDITEEVCLEGLV